MEDLANGIDPNAPVEPYVDPRVPIIPKIVLSKNAPMPMGLSHLVSEMENKYR